MFTFADPKEWWLELSQAMYTDAIRQSQRCSASASCQRTYLNALCLNAVFAWIRADVTDAIPHLASVTPAIWEVVNGTAIELGSTRLVLIPTEAIDVSELEVQQEWIDSPSWAGDYYLAVQVSSEQGWVRVWGYTTHQELKLNGSYDSIDRTYSLEAEQLTLDLNAFWAIYQFCGAAQTRSEIAPLPILSDTQATNLIQRLGDSAIMFPRLTVPFDSWAALLARSDWLQALYLKRCGEQTPSTLVRFRDWFQGQFAAVWQAVDTVLLPAQVVTAWRSSKDESMYEINRVKVLEFGGECAIALIIGITRIDSTQANLRLHICPIGENATFSQAIEVRLLDGTGAEVGQARAVMTETIQFQFGGQVGEQFRVEVTLGDRTVTELFEI